MLTWLLVDPWALEHQILRPGVLEAAGLAGWHGSAGQKVSVPVIQAVGATRKQVADWQLLARMLTVIVDQLWALYLEICRPGVLEATGLAGWDLLARMLTWL